MVRKAMNHSLSVGQLLKYGCLAAILWFAWSEHQKAQAVRMQAGWTKQINDSTVAQTAGSELNRDTKSELAALTDAAKALKGTLLAAVKLQTHADSVQKPLQEVIASTVAPDGTRTAHLVDTTKSGIQVRIDAEAPPAPANLKLGYSVVVPPFEPSVGFVRTGQTYAAVVSWAGQQTTIEKAFYIPDGTPPAPTWSLSTASTVGGGQGFFRKPDWSLTLDRKLGEHTRLKLSEKASWYTGTSISLSVEQRLWTSR